ncbi:hypothetical protein DMW20_26090, partial [Vibrio parahaemolyticus]|nr:hypothetical protein [Vibrio parahaemolyticus]
LRVISEQFLLMMVVARRLYTLKDSNLNNDYSRLFDTLENIREELKKINNIENIVESRAYELLDIELDTKNSIEVKTNLVGERLFSILLSAYEKENENNSDFNYINLATSFSTLVDSNFRQRRRVSEDRKKKVEALTTWARQDLQKLIVKVVHKHQLPIYENIKNDTYGYSISTLYFGLAKREDIFEWLKRGLSIDKLTTNDFQSYLQDSPIPLNFNNLIGVDELITGEDVNRNDQSICFAELPIDRVIQLAESSELDSLAGAIVKKWHSVAYSSDGSVKGNVKPVVLSDDEVREFLKKWSDLSIPIRSVKKKRSLINSLQYHEAIYWIDMAKPNIKGTKRPQKDLLNGESLLSSCKSTGKTSTADRSEGSIGFEEKVRDGNSASSRQRRYKELCELMSNFEDLKKITDELKSRSIPFKFNGLTPFFKCLN